VLQRLPDGLASALNERGGNLSGGQRQRLALARGALAAEGSSLLLLDEPTSALDPEAEAKVFDRMFAAFPSACIVASVHRPGLLARFDTVVVLEAGRAVDAGPRDEVLARRAH
jgi:ATP-binding cassette subfamily B protein